MTKINKAIHPGWTWHATKGYIKVAKEKPPEIIHQEKKEPGRKKRKPFVVKTT